MVGRASVVAGVQAHTTGNATATKTSFRVDNRMSALSSLDEIGVLLLKDGEVSLSVPIPDGIGSKEQVHFFKRALVGFGVQGPNHGDSDDVTSTEYVERLFTQSGEHDRAKKS